MANTENEKLDEEQTEDKERISVSSSSSKPEAAVTETCRPDEVSITSPLLTSDIRDITILPEEQNVLNSGNIEEDDEVSKIMFDQFVPETDDASSDVVVTEVIMSKTFTESIAPDQEFIPIGDTSAVDATTSCSDSAPAVDRKSPACDVENGVTATTDEKADDRADRTDADVEGTGNVVQLAGAQVRDLAGEFYRLIGLLDNLSNPLQARNNFAVDDEFSSSSDDQIDEDDVRQRDDDVTAGAGEQTRVVYKYRVRLTSGRRWIRRPRSDEDSEADRDDTSTLPVEESSKSPC